MLSNLRRTFSQKWQVRMTSNSDGHQPRREIIHHTPDSDGNQIVQYSALKTLNMTAFTRFGFATLGGCDDETKRYQYRIYSTPNDQRESL